MLVCCKTNNSVTFHYQNQQHWKTTFNLRWCLHIKKSVIKYSVCIFDGQSIYCLNVHTGLCSNIDFWNVICCCRSVWNSYCHGPFFLSQFCFNPCLQNWLHTLFTTCWCFYLGLRCPNNLASFYDIFQNKKIILPFYINGFEFDIRPEKIRLLIKVSSKLSLSCSYCLGI